MQILKEKGIARRDMDGPLRPGSVVFARDIGRGDASRLRTHAWTEIGKEVLVKMRLRRADADGVGAPRRPRADEPALSRRPDPELSSHWPINM